MAEVDAIPILPQNIYIIALNKCRAATAFVFHRYIGRMWSSVKRTGARRNFNLSVCTNTSLIPGDGAVMCQIAPRHGWLRIVSAPFTGTVNAKST